MGHELSCWVAPEALASSDGWATAGTMGTVNICARSVAFFMGYHPSILINWTERTFSRRQRQRILLTEGFDCPKV